MALVCPYCGQPLPVVQAAAVADPTLLASVRTLYLTLQQTPKKDHATRERLTAEILAFSAQITAAEAGTLVELTKQKK
jgi:hypothetical protein